MRFVFGERRRWSIEPAERPSLEPRRGKEETRTYSVLCEVGAVAPRSLARSLSGSFRRLRYSLRPSTYETAERLAGREEEQGGGGRTAEELMAAATQDVVQYSEPHSQSGNLVRFSPSGRYVASAAGYRLILRDVDTLQILQLYSCIDEIEGLEWSCDSEYVLCSIQKRGAAQVWSLSNKEWHCKIDEGPVGLAHARFSPDGRHVLATADFRLRITIWSLCDRSVFYIRFPKHVRAPMPPHPSGSDAQSACPSR